MKKNTTIKRSKPKKQNDFALHLGDLRKKLDQLAKYNSLDPTNCLRHLITEKHRSVFGDNK